MEVDTIVVHFEVPLAELDNGHHRDSFAAALENFRQSLREIFPGKSLTTLCERHVWTSE